VRSEDDSMLDSTTIGASLDTADVQRPTAAVVDDQTEIVCDPHLVSLYHRIAPVAAIGAMLVAGVVLAGWLIDFHPMTSFGPNRVRMKANSAIIFLLLGASLYLVATHDRLSRQAKVLIQTSIGLVFAVAGASLIEDILGTDLGIDQLLFTMPPEAPLAVHPGRMAPLTSTAAIALGVALLVVQTRSTRCNWLLSLSSISSQIIALNVLLGYAFNDSELYTLAGHTAAASLPTGFTILFLSIGTLCASPNQRLFRRLASAGSGGYMLRRLMPMAFGCIVAVVGIRLWGQHAGFFETNEFGAAAGSATLIVCMGVILVWAARKLDEIDRARAAAEANVRHLNSLLNRRLSDLEAANNELEAFSYSVSHDLRTPLRAIDGFSRILWDEYRDRLDGEGERIIKVVRDGATKMARLIDDILAFSRAGRMELTMTPVDMKELVHDVLLELQPVIASRQVRFAIADLPQAAGDQPMLRRVWHNLLSNAVKYTGTHETAVIEVGFESAPAGPIYFIKDDGVGFDMRFADNLFGVFRRLHGTDEFPGTGIGLAIVKRIITRHGGSVWAHGEPDKGATIYFALPAAKEREDGDSRRD
jgi:signal transduction histidine kinase